MKKEKKRKKKKKENRTCAEWDQHDDDHDGRIEDTKLRGLRKKKKKKKSFPWPREAEVARFCLT